MKRARINESMLYDGDLLWHKKCGSPLYDTGREDPRSTMLEYHLICYCKTCDQELSSRSPQALTYKPATKPQKGKRRAKAKSSGRSYISRDTKLRVLERQKHKCASCGKALKPGRYHIDHKRAVALGGSDSIRNLQGLCPNCHDRKNKEDARKIARARK